MIPTIAASNSLQPVTWLIDNHQWFLSGAGIAIATGVLGFVGWLFRRKSPNVPGPSIAGQSGSINVMAGNDVKELTIKQGLSYSEVRQIAHEVASQNTDSTDLSEKILAALSRLHSNSVPVSQCLAEVAVLAARLQDSSLEKFCRNELTGWGRENIELDDPPVHRKRQVYLALTARINLDCGLWGQSSASVFRYIEDHPEDFTPFEMMLGEPLPKIEALQNMDLERGVPSRTLPLGSLLPDAPHPEHEVVIYIEPRAFIEIIKSVRVELSKRLLKHVSSHD